MLRKVNHCIVTTNADQVNDLSWAAVHRDFASFNSVVGRHVTPGHGGRPHHVSDVYVINFIQTRVACCSTGPGHHVPLKSLARLVGNLLTLEDRGQSHVLLEVVREVSPSQTAQISLGGRDQISNISCLKSCHDLNSLRYSKLSPISSRLLNPSSSCGKQHCSPPFLDQ